LDVYVEVIYLSVTHSRKLHFEHTS
jgi:hypothetical protein